MVGTTLHPLLLELHHILQGSCLEEVIVSLVTVHGHTHVLSVHILPQHRALVDALCAEAVDGTILGQVEGRFGLRHVVDDFVERTDGIHHLVSLGRNTASVHERILAVRREGETSTRSISQTTAFTHFLEDDGTHVSVEVFVVESQLRFNRYIVSVVAVRELRDVSLLSYVRSHKDAGLVGSLISKRFGSRHFLQRFRHLVFSLQEGKKLFLSSRTVVKDTVLVAVQCMDTVNQFLWLHGLQFLFTEDVSVRILRSVLSVCRQTGEVLALVKLGILTRFEFVVHQVGISSSVYLRIGQQLLEQGNGLRHVFMQTRKAEVSTFVARIDTESASHVVESTLHFLRSHVRSAEVFQILGSHAQGLVVIVAHIEDVFQLEDAVGGVLLVEHFDARLCLKDVHILFEINELRFDRLDYRSNHFVQEYTGSITVHLDRRNGRLGNDFFVRVLAFTLVHHHVAFGSQVLVGQCHHVFLGELRQAVDEGYLVCPVGAVDER